MSIDTVDTVGPETEAGDAGVVAEAISLFTSKTIWGIITLNTIGNG